MSYCVAIMPIFKYLTAENGMRYLDTWHLKFSHRDEFNDSYEMAPSTDYSGMDLGFISPEQFEKNGKDMRKGIPDTPAMRDAFGEMHDLMLVHLPDGVGALCFSENENSLKMWDRYADVGRGVLFGFDHRHGCFNRPQPPQGNFFGYLDRVRYVNAPPKFLLNPYRPHDAINEIFRTKDAETWGHEKEIRILWPFDAADRTSESNGRSHYLYSVPPNALMCVIVGPRATSQLDAIREKLNARAADCAQVSLWMARRQANSFGSVYEPVPR